MQSLKVVDRKAAIIKLEALFQAISESCADVKSTAELTASQQNSITAVENQMILVQDLHRQAWVNMTDNSKYHHDYCFVGFPSNDAARMVMRSTSYCGGILLPS